MSVTATGFDRLRLAEIKANYDALFTEALGPVNTAPDAVVGQIIGIFSAALDDAYEVLQSTYDAMYPRSATGTSLDGAVSFVGLTRIPASASTVVGLCGGTEGTLIPAGALARMGASTQFAAAKDVVIGRANAGRAVIEVSTVADGADYQIIAGGYSHTYHSGTGATGESIVAGLFALFDTDLFSATADGTRLILTSADKISAFTLTCGSKLTISELASPVTFVCAALGAVAVPAGALTKIDTSLDGWSSLTNPVAGETGRDVETDEELRQRHASSKRVTGAATVAAISARLLDAVAGVDYVRIYENRTASIVDGMPAHSFETIVSGGADSAVGAKLWEVKPAGIETHGQTAVTVTDENGDAHPVKFSRPSIKYAWLRVTVSSYNPEETPPADLAAVIKSAILAQGATMQIGDDLVVQKFIGPIYSAASGLGAITIDAAITAAPGDAPGYSTANIPVARSDLALFDAARVIVVGV
jgi:uncharacterized phage protein gp47/JayE